MTARPLSAKLIMVKNIYRIRKVGEGWVGVAGINGCKDVQLVSATRMGGVYSGSVLPSMAVRMMTSLLWCLKKNC